MRTPTIGRSRRRTASQRSGRSNNASKLIHVNLACWPRLSSAGIAAMLQWPWAQLASNPHVFYGRGTWAGVVCRSCEDFPLAIVPIVISVVTRLLFESVIREKAQRDFGAVIPRIG